ncbi:MAG: glycosyltransferase [Bowdeniella nasicola]|nr:glycosyltransferase [Bowdeniella nasicola]
MHAQTVTAVVVAYNRRDLLTQTLTALAGQSRPVDRVLVIDNASTDDSAGVATAHPVGAEVITMPRNLGGAGGFTAGIARAVNAGADLVWLMDDDTIPSATALEALLQARADYPGTPAVLASRAVWKDGRQHPMNTPRNRPGASRELRQHAAQIDTRQIRSASFVSVLIDARAIWEDGLPEADFFLWNDDFEYTARLLRHRVGLYVPASVVTHMTRTFGASEVDPGARFYNEVRNKIWVFTRSEALNPVEKLLYGGRSVLRWLQTLAASGQKRALLEYAGQGIRDATLPPVPSHDIFADTPVHADVCAIQRRAGLLAAELQGYA